MCNVTSKYRIVDRSERGSWVCFGVVTPSIAVLDLAVTIDHAPWRLRVTLAQSRSISRSLNHTINPVSSFHDTCHLSYLSYLLSCSCHLHPFTRYTNKYLARYRLHHETPTWQSRPQSVVDTVNSNNHELSTSLPSLTPRDTIGVRSAYGFIRLPEIGSRRQRHGRISCNRFYFRWLFVFCCSLSTRQSSTRYYQLPVDSGCVNFC